MNQDIELVLPLESSEFVIQNAKSVQLNQEAIEQLATKVKNLLYIYYNFKKIIF
jgi:hypothetical protein